MWPRLDVRYAFETSRLEACKFLNNTPTVTQASQQHHAVPARSIHADFAGMAFMQLSSQCLCKGFALSEAMAPQNHRNGA